VKVLFDRIGYSYKIGKFNAMFNRALELTEGGVETGKTSIRAFMQIVKELHDVE
jgi:Flp pilus assembly protein TadB